MPQLGGGGGERVISILLNNISREAFEPHIMIVKKDGDNTFIKDLKDDVEVHYLNIIKPIRISFLQIVKKVLKILKKEKADIVFFGSGQLNALFSLFLGFLPKSCKKIARESNIPSKFEKFVALKLLYRFFYKNYDEIIVQSNDMFDDLNKNFKIPGKRLTKINNPIDVDYIETKLKEKSTGLLPQNSYNLLAAGRLTYQKGFDLLIDELAKIGDKLDYHLTILGIGEDKLKLENQLNNLQLSKRVTLKGTVTNPYLYMHEADLFILSSRFEGFPNVALESLMCGTPVLANNCLGGINEIIIPKYNGLIYSYEKSNFENKLMEAVETEFSKEDIIENTIERFSIEKKVKEFENCILE